MKLKRHVVVLDAADLDAESGFWAAVLGGEVEIENEWHSVTDADGESWIDVQLAPNHVPPQWPDGDQQQQIHLDLYVGELAPAHNEVIALGARLLRAAEDPEADAGFQVYADPAGHPFCLCWG